MKFLKPVAAAILGLALTSSAHASASQCTTRIDGEPVTIFYSTDDPTFSSMRERFFRRGECPGAVVVTYLTPELTAEERTVFCANYNPETRSHSQPAQGRRDRFGRCVEPSKTCELVNATRQEATALMGLGAQAEERGGVLPAAISAATHTSGALILSGNLGSVTTLLGSVGTAAAAPAMLAGAAASVVVIGGAIYLCSD